MPASPGIERSAAMSRPSGDARAPTYGPRAPSTVTWERADPSGAAAQRSTPLRLKRTLPGPSAAGGGLADAGVRTAGAGLEQPMSTASHPRAMGHRDIGDIGDIYIREVPGRSAERFAL